MYPASCFKAITHLWPPIEWTLWSCCGLCCWLQQALTLHLWTHLYVYNDTLLGAGWNKQIITIFWRTTVDRQEVSQTEMHALSFNIQKSWLAQCHLCLHQRWQHQDLATCIRMGAPQKMISLVRAIYTSPRFRIEIPEGISDELHQEIGIRQRCPLSPYLYIIATSCQMTDLLRDIQDLDTEPPTGARYPTLLFADDTLLLTDKAAHMEQLLQLMIEHSIPYNLTLNKDKCQLLVTNDVGSRGNFPDDTPVSRQE